MKIRTKAGRRILLGLNTLIILCCLLGAPLTVWGGLGVESVYGDFNGDGFADLAIGLPFTPIGGVDGTGLVRVFYGSNLSGLISISEQQFDPNSPGMPEEHNNGEGFGFVLAVGDFNADGFADLAIGVPGETVDNLAVAGAVHVLYGTAAGLTTAKHQLFHQNQAGMQDVAEANDGFGFPLTAGDFNGDGFADLAIGVLGEAVNNLTFAGAVQVLYGTARGLTTVGNQLWHQNRPGLPDVAEAEDRFGFSLTTGDFNGDGFADLAIGIIGETVRNLAFAGAVQVLYGSAKGLSAVGNQLLHQNLQGIRETAEVNDQFGFSLMAGDFNGDGFADLAIGTPAETIDQLPGAGVVHVLYGTAKGLTTVNSQVFHQNRSGIPEESEGNDFFGLALTAGDFNRDGFTDLAIGAPSETVGNLTAAGVVHVLYGTAKGLKITDTQLFQQDIPGIPDVAETQDTFGFALAAGDFDHDGFSDLTVIAFAEQIDNYTGGGAAHLLYGSRRGLSVVGNILLPLGFIGSPGPCCKR